MASTYATFTNNTVPSTSKFTWSAWVKRGKLGTQQSLFSGAQSSTTGQMIYFNGAADQLGFYGIASSTVRVDKYTTMKFRDVNAWYHIVVAYDSTLSTASDRVKFYVNGELQQLNGTDVQVQGWEPYYMLTSPTDIGRDAMGTSSYFDGEISHMNFVIGTVYDASAFGETDSTTGEWKIKTSPSVTYGSDGFFVLKDGNSLTDQSGNSNNFTVGGGTLTKTEDSPSNVFATWNPLNYDFANNPSTFAKGNTYVKPTQTTAYNTGVSTLAMPKGNGKFYTEIKYHSSGNENGGFGIIDMDYVNKTYYENYNLMSETTATTIGRVIYAKTGAVVTGGGVEIGSFGGTWSNGDIIQIACDMENGAIYFGKNGTWQNSGVPTSGASRTGAVNTSAESWWTGTSQWGLWCGKKVSTTDIEFEGNFGNGHFGIPAVASAGTNASGNGIFEYDVPTGYTALSTKGLNL